MGEKEFYRRHLPHYQPADATFFVTFRLAGSLPAEVIEQLRVEREQFLKTTGEIKDQNKRRRLRFREQYFKRFDALLDGHTSGPMWLRKPAVAEIVKETHHLVRARESIQGRPGKGLERVEMELCQRRIDRFSGITFNN